MSLFSQSTPKYSLQQKVRITLNERNKTPYIGSIREIFWHYKEQRYYYLIDSNGKKISKRYFEEDLESID